MRLSDAGIALLREFEGLRLQAYRDSAGVWTIGYGSTFYADGDKVRPGDEITAERAESLLRETLRTYESAIDRLVTVPLSQSQFDALTALVYNIGVGAFEKSTLLKRLNEGQYAKAANEFLRWIHAGGQPLAGLRRRRERERALFLSVDLVDHANRTPGVQSTSVEIPPASVPTAPDVSTNVETLPNLHTHAPHRSDIERDNAPSMSELYPDLSSNSKPPNFTISPQPMAPVLAALLPSIVGMIPELAKLFGSGSDVATRNVQAAQRVAEVVVAATSAPNLQGAVEAMERDPAALAAAQDAVRREWFALGERSVADARKYAVEYAQAKDVRTVVGRLTFLELLSLVLLAISSAFGAALLHMGLLKGELLGAIVMLVVVAGFADIRRFWLGLPANEPPKD